MLAMAAVLVITHFVATQNAESATAVRQSALIPGSVATLSAALGLGTADPATVMLRVIRQVYGGSDVQAQQSRTALLAFLNQAELSGDRVPLPLGEELWTGAILQGSPDHAGLITTILRDRGSALVYYGLAALDDETLQWISAHRPTLLHVQKHPEIFAAFCRSLHIRDGRIIVPGGRDAEPLWRATVGADPARADAFVERLISGDGRLAFLYDVVAHLETAQQRFVLGLQLTPGGREQRFRSVRAAFASVSPEWKVRERPFSRPPLDGAIVFSTIRANSNGVMVPRTRRLWDRVFRGDELNDVPYTEITDRELRETSGSLMIDAAWLADHILRTPYAIGRRRLDVLLFAQRVFGERPDAESAQVATALRGYLSFPALMIELERMGLRDPSLYVRAAEHAAQLNRLQPVADRRNPIAEFQSTIALISSTARSGHLGVSPLTSLLTSLWQQELSSRARYHMELVRWFREIFLPVLPKRATLEETLVAAVAGVRDAAPAPLVEWEGRRYHVNLAAAEFNRIRAIRDAQQGPTLDAAMASDDAQALADVLMSIVYAIHLGGAEGPAVTSGNVALRHDFGLVAPPATGSSDAWRLPMERFDGKDAWRMRGSLLGLDAALARLVLQRVDRTAMPGEPTLGPHDRQTVMLTAALLDSNAISDQSRDTIASAIARGRERVVALAEDPAQVNEVADAAGLSEWRRQALAWSVAQHRHSLSSFSLLELFWLGHSNADATAPLDAWGAVTQSLNGCLCLQFPPPRPWEELAGYATELLASRAADVSLKIAETLSTLKLPAVLAPALAGFVTQDVIDHAQLGCVDDWEAFSRAVIDIPRERMVDYIAALTVSGPLVEVK